MVAVEIRGLCGKCWTSRQLIPKQESGPGPPRPCFLTNCPAVHRVEGGHLGENRISSAVLWFSCSDPRCWIRAATRSSSSPYRHNAGQNEELSLVRCTAPLYALDCSCPKFPTSASWVLPLCAALRRIGWRSVRNALLVSVPGVPDTPRCPASSVVAMLCLQRGAGPLPRLPKSGWPYVQSLFLCPVVRRTVVPPLGLLPCW